MNFEQIESVIKDAQKLNPSLQWATVLNKLRRWATDKVTMDGIVRYIIASQKIQVPLNASTFMELLDDAEHGVAVWQEVDNDTVNIIGKRIKKIVFTSQ